MYTLKCHCIVLFVYLFVCKNEGDVSVGSVDVSRTMVGELSLRSSWFLCGRYHPSHILSHLTTCSVCDQLKIISYQHECITCRTQGYSRRRVTLKECHEKQKRWSWEVLALVSAMVTQVLILTHQFGSFSLKFVCFLLRQKVS